MTVKKKKVFTLTKSQQKLILEVESRHRAELNDVLLLLQEELGLDPNEEKGRFMLTRDRSAFVEIEAVPSQIKEDGDG